MRHPERDTEYPYKWSVQNLFIHLLILCGSSHHKSTFIFFFIFKLLNYMKQKFEKRLLFHCARTMLSFLTKGLRSPPPLSKHLQAKITMWDKMKPKLYTPGPIEVDRKNIPSYLPIRWRNKVAQMEIYLIVRHAFKKKFFLIII